MGEILNQDRNTTVNNLSFLKHNSIGKCLRSWLPNLKQNYIKLTKMEEAKPDHDRIGQQVQNLFHFKNIYE